MTIDDFCSSEQDLYVQVKPGHDTAQLIQVITYDLTWMTRRVELVSPTFDVRFTVTNLNPKSSILYLEPTLKSK